MNAFKQMVTGKDNETHDLIRWCALASVVVGLALAIYSVVLLKQHFDLQAYGVGIGALFAATGGALALKAKTEPDPCPRDEPKP